MTLFLIVCVLLMFVFVNLGEKHRVFSFLAIVTAIVLAVGLFTIPTFAHEYLNRYHNVPLAGVTAVMYTQQQNALHDLDRVVVEEADVELLAHLTYAEGNTLGEEGMLYVGSVVINRVNSNQYPNSIYDVIYDDGQYACVTDGHFYNEPSDLAWEIAEGLLTEGSVLPEYVLYQSEFEQGVVYEQWGIHTFATR